jgi:putative nucleotidyltransferase with HDIG domain
MRAPQPTPTPVSQLVERLRDIPTLSTVVTTIMGLVNDPRASAGQIADVLRRDQILSAKVLRTVNSSFYNLATEVTDVTKALGFLGFNTISALVLGTSVFSSFELKASPYFDVMEFWRHSLAAALAAELFARKIRHPRPEDAFTCGLLHDIGKVALFRVSPDDMKAVVEKALLERTSFLDAETALGLPGHTVLGERLAERWQLPVMIRKTIRYHHRDITALETIFPKMKPVIMLASLGNVLANGFAYGHSGHRQASSYPDEYIRALGLTSEHLREVEAQMPAEMERGEAFLEAALK